MAVGQEKKCTKCKEWKPVEAFSHDKYNKDGKRSRCKDCMHKEGAKYRREHPDVAKAAMKRWKESNPNYYQEYMKRNKEKLKKKGLKYRAENPHAAKIWKKENPERVKVIRHRLYKKIVSTPRGKLRWGISRAIGDSLRQGAKSGRKWESLVGYTVDQLKVHLEKMFEPWMTWDNYGEWHIDHVIPISAFNFEYPEDLDFKRCWALNNLQPLEAKTNIIKKAKIDRPFQPSLALQGG